MIKPPVSAPPGPAAGAAPIVVGVSACLLGHRVRWDGGHKSDASLTGMLGRYVQWVPLCPEVEVGLPVPPALDRDQRAETDELIEDYRRELVPLLAPLTLLRHHVRRQVYLEPNPKELMLRHHA